MTRREARREFRRNRGAVLGLLVVGILLIAAALAPLLAPHEPTHVDSDQLLRPPGRGHLLGTDQYGRDVLSRILHGATSSLQVGIISVGIAALGGLLLGLLSGFYGRWVDLAVMRVIDVMLAFPSILLALGIVAVLGPSLNNVMLAVGIAGIPVYTRLVRGQVLATKSLAYVEAARTVGCGDVRIVGRHILPNIVAPVIVVATLGIAGGILTGAALSFLGLGAQPPSSEWGAMLSDGRSFLRQAWWVTTFPGLAITITVLAINMVGDGLRDALDPRLKT
jgi:ABC-type dipeptide/oligopeptide/nickel transport system permease subunit